MATIMGCMGESGGGKTTAARTLDPKTTYYIDADKKGLSWKGWKAQYSEAAKNYFRSSDASKIWSTLKGVSEKRPDIKTIIVDTVNGIMVDDEMNRLKEKGYDKWQDLALSVYNMISDSHFLREDLIIIFMFHVQDNADENGNHHYHILTSGRKLDKIKLESKLTTVLFAKGNEGIYFFETQARNSTAKSPMGLFNTLEIPNDLLKVTTAIREYERG
jgi:hypothetical protein